jgi:hypothetical protein
MVQMVSVMMPVWRGLSSAVRGVGATLDAIGAAVQGHLAQTEKLMPPINRLTFQGSKPAYGDRNFVAPNAAIIGDVTLGPRTNVWYGATLRGDVNSIKIGSSCSIQDRVVIHVAKNNPAGQSLSTILGDNVCSSCREHAYAGWSCRMEHPLELSSTARKSAVLLISVPPW